MIDIIIPTYRRHTLLPSALASVQRQSYTDWHCWISEDGTKDPDTEKSLAPFLADQRFTYISGPQHAGFPAPSRNRAITQGRGEFIAFLDDDDLWLPEKLERQVAFLESHPGSVMVGSNGYRWDGDPLKLTTPLPVYYRKKTSGKVNVARLLRENCFITSSVMVRRAALERAGLFNEHITPPVGEDIELWYRLTATGDLWFQEDPLVIYRDTPNKFYETLKGDALNRWRINLLEAALVGSNIPSPLLSRENQALKKLFETTAEYFKTGPHHFGLFGYHLKKKLGLLARDRS